jgi:preprotein translocase subunit SecA
VVIVPTNKPMIRKDFQDKIYKTEEAKFQAIVEDIIAHHKQGQPVLVGTVSIEKNELLGDMLYRRGVPHQILNAKHHEKEAFIIAQAGKLNALTVATNMAGRGVDIMLGGNPPDLKEHKKIISLGGLYVIGTERHEARRIDNQLRGRSGRQGDPGSSCFYVSLEDDLMRLFGSERVALIMERLRFPEDQPIEHPIISRSLESAQKKVEGNNFDIRKHLLEYDDVMNKHREVIYKKRREVLKLKNLKSEILQMIGSEIADIVSVHMPENKTEIYEVINTIFPLPHDAKQKIEKTEGKEELIAYLQDLNLKTYEEKERELGEDTMRILERAVYLRSIDTLWIEHLDATDRLREGIGLRAYGQKDPLVEFKSESHLMFQKLLSGIQNNVVYSIYKVSIIKRPSPMETEQARESRGREEQRIKTVSKGVKVGRNDPCPCGSGKKYKKCCGR